MLFSFLKYLQPTHYFQLYKKDGTSIFPKVETLPKEIVAQLEPEKKFISETARQYDLSWQAVNKGYIGNSEVYSSFQKIPLIDEYRFIRKYFHPVWVFYVLMLRIFTFNNPFGEIVAWRKSGDTLRSNYLNTPIQYPDWSSWQSPLLAEKPLVSVVIPTLNRYEYLKDVLADFEKQTYKNFEILIIDQSQPFQKDFCNGFNLKIRHIQQSEPALWLARNTAIEKSEGSIIALSEDDVRINPDWIENHLRCLDFFKADISAGVFFPEGSTIPPERSFFCVASQFATGNAILYKDIFKRIGMFDRQFEKQRMGDGEFGLRAYLNGFKNISNPKAKRIHLKVAQGGLRQMGSWDGWRPKKLLSPRPVPSVLYLSRSYFGNKKSVLMLMTSILPSIVPYKLKRNKFLKLLSIVLFPVLVPLVSYQVFLSWKQASVKLKQGSLIEKL